MQPEMILLDNLSVIEFQGTDSGQFLQAQLTADLANLAQGQGVFAGCCNPAGRVLGVMLLTRQADRYLAVVSAELAETLRGWLSRYVLRAKVQILLRPDLVVCGVPASVAPTAEAILLETPHGHYALAPGTAVDPAARDLASWREWRAQELLAGITWLDEAGSGKFLPQMIGLQHVGALSFKKGCYPGQEVIARMRYLGKLKRHPVLVRVAEPLECERLQAVELKANGQEAGAVVADQVVTEGGGALLLLVARMNPPFAPESLEIGAERHVVVWSALPGPAGPAT
jgi:folate-binding protein YgfZ